MGTPIEDIETRFDALVKRVDSLERRLDLLVADMPEHITEREFPPAGTIEEFYGASSAESRNVAPYAEVANLIPRGKYAGKSHELVVQADPEHVLWLAANARSEGLGYTEEHIKQAAENAKLRPMSRIKKPSYR